MNLWNLPTRGHFGNGLRSIARQVPKYGYYLANRTTTDIVGNDEELHSAIDDVENGRMLSKEE